MVRGQILWQWIWNMSLDESGEIEHGYELVFDRD